MIPIRVLVLLSGALAVGQSTTIPAHIENAKELACHVEHVSAKRKDGRVVWSWQARPVIDFADGTKQEIKLSRRQKQKDGTHDCELWITMVANERQQVRAQASK